MTFAGRAVSFSVLPPHGLTSPPPVVSWPLPEDNTSKLVREIAGGDPGALGTLYDRYAGLVHGLALRTLRNPHEAEEVVQEVFLQVWHQATRFDAGRGSVTAWLCTIARSRALDRLRRQLARREEPEESLPAAATNPRNEEALAVRHALDGLTPDQKRALELAYYEGLSQSEIAARLGQPLGTIKTRMRTALIRLREVLGPVS